MSGEFGGRFTNRGTQVLASGCPVGERRAGTADLDVDGSGGVDGASTGVIRVRLSLSSLRKTSAGRTIRSDAGCDRSDEAGAARGGSDSAVQAAAAGQTPCRCVLATRCRRGAEGRPCCDGWIWRSRERERGAASPGHWLPQGRLHDFFRRTPGGRTIGRFYQSILEVRARAARPSAGLTRAVAFARGRAGEEKVDSCVVNMRM